MISIPPALSHGTSRPKGRDEPLRRELADLRLPLDSIQDAFALIDAAGTVVWGNTDFERMVGRSQSNIIGRALAPLLPLQMNGRPLAPKLHPARRVLEDRRPLKGYYSMKHGNDVTAIGVWGKKMAPRHGNPAAILVFRDVSSHNRMAEDLARKTRKLERSNIELAQFAHAVSHDLQEPLRTVTGYAQLLADRCRHQLGADADAYIADILDGAGRMNRMIEALLDYSKIGGPERQCEPTDCAQALERSLASLRSSILECGARVSHSPLPVVSAPPLQIERLFQNLIGNALKFRAAREPRIRVSAKRHGADWIFSVHDNGIGIDARHLPRLFNFFQRLNPRDKYPGTGIGLAVCKKIVEENGGRIWAQSSAGRGSTFRFTMPA